MYRAEKKSLQILLSRTQAGPGRKVKQEQEEISRNHVPRFFLSSVYDRRRVTLVVILARGLGGDGGNGMNELHYSRSRLQVFTY